MTTDNSGEKNRPNKKKIPVVTAVSPERPPTAIPAEDSTYAPTGDVPKSDPASIAVESDANAFPTRGILLSFMKPAWLANPTNVPAVSKKVTNKNVKTTTHICSVLISPTCFNATKKVEDMLGAAETIEPGA